MKKRLSAFLAVSLIINLLGIHVFSEKENENDNREIIRIETAEDFLYFAKSCVSDSFSKDKQVILSNDIDMSGSEIEPVEVFCGEFDGYGHTIKNVNCEFTGNDKGLFVRIAKDAVVKNLTVSGKISCKSDSTDESGARQIIGKLFQNTGIKSDIADNLAENLGGIAANNEGTIANCVFTGSLDGESSVGGIVGYNQNRGNVENCRNEGEINGQLNIGGISGRNDGYIRTSKNISSVNKKANEKSSDIGGIAGISNGVVDSCDNTGEIGCENIGTNVGGVCGKQSGLVSESSNSGLVLGSRGIGGIVGRFEPFGDITEETLKKNVENNLQDFSDDVKDITDQIEDLGFEWKDDIKDFCKELLGVDLTKDGLGLSSIKDDVSSLTDSIKGNTDQLTDSTTRVLDSINGKVNQDSKVDGVVDSLTGLADRTTDAIDHIDRGTDGMGNDIRDAFDSLDKIGGETSTLVQSLDDAVTKTMDDIDAGKGDRDELVDKITSLVDDLNSGLNSNSENIDDTLSTLTDTLDDFNDDVIAPLSKNLKSTHTSINEILTKLKSTTDKVSTSVTAPLERIDALVSDKIDKLEKLNSAITELEEKLKAIIDSKKNPSATATPKPTDTAKFSVFSTAYAADDEDDDTNDSEERDKKSVDIELKRMVGGKFVDDALMIYCYNSGVVTGVDYVGGIAGVVGTESKLKSGKNQDLPDSDLLKTSDFVKAVINGCMNESEINSRNGNTGGISGYSNIGIIKNCLGCGTIKAEDGQYLGGICGRSFGKIENSIGIADLYGKSDIGGICGDGEYIHTSYSMPQIFKGTERIGAIAGNTGSDIKNNYCIDEGLGGIDGADFDGQAVALSLDDITADGVLPYKMEGFINDDWIVSKGEKSLPQIKLIATNKAENIGMFLAAKSDEYSKTTFTVKFVLDGEEIKTVYVPYGGVVDSAEIPALPERDGFYGAWDRDIAKKIIRKTTFTAVFREATSTISSGENPPILLVEGNFVENTTLTLENLSLDNVSFPDYNIQQGYSFTISSGFSGHVLVRVRDEGEKCVGIGIIDKSGVQVIDSHRDGSYLVFELESPVGFYMLRNRSMAFPIIISCIALVLLAAIVVFIILVKKKKIIFKLKGM